MIIEFCILGTPKPQPRPRAFARVIGGRPVARVYDAGSAEGWKGSIALAATPHRPAVPFRGPLYVDIDFLFPRPKCRQRKADPDVEYPHTVKPDRDNVEKSTLDALKVLGFFEDDCQVCGGEVRKLWTAKGGVAGARVKITAPADGAAFREMFKARETAEAK